MRFLVLALALSVTGCISTEHSSDRVYSDAEQAKKIAYAVNSDGLVCKKEKPTGTHFAVKVCRTVAEMERMREKADRTSRRMRTNNQVNRGTTSG